MRKVFIARNRKTNFHSFFEVVPGDWTEGRLGTFDMDTVNEFVGTKTLGDLVSFLDSHGPLIAKDIYKEAKRAIPIADAVEIAEAMGRGLASEGFDRNDPLFLRLQLYMDGKNGTYPSKASVSRDSAAHGLLESNAFEDLKEWKSVDPNARVVIEPLSDVCLLRNICSIALRVVANSQKEEADRVLEESGFVRIDRSRKWWVSRQLKDSYYVLPLHHNPGDDMTLNFSTKWFRNVFAYMVINPLNEAIRESRPKGWKNGYGRIKTADILTAPTITGNPRPILNFSLNIEEEDTRLYLALSDEGTQIEAAQSFIRGLSSTFSDLSGPAGNGIGWSMVDPSILGNGYIQPFFETTASALVGSVIYRWEKLPMTCKNCGNGMFVRTKGKRKEFCSSACRSKYYVSKDSNDG